MCMRRTPPSSWLSSAILSGASQREREALRPGANRTVNGGRSDAVFAGVGVLEVVFDPAVAARVAARRILASMPTNRTRSRRNRDDRSQFL